MKTINFSRPKEQINSTFNYSIIIDGKQVSKLANGETIEIQVPDDAQYLSTQLMWCGSSAIPLSDVKDGDSIRVKGNTFLNRTLPFLTLAILFLGTLFSDGMVMKVVMTSVIVFAMLSLLGTLTLGRNKWLILKSV